MTLLRLPAGKCVICGSLLSLLDAQTAPVCRSPACRWKDASTPKNHRCKTCGRPLSLSELVAGLCSAMVCRRAWRVEEMRQRRAHEERQARQLRREGAVALGITHPESYPLAHIPRSTNTVTRLPRRRRRAFRARLRGLIREAFARGPVEHAPAQSGLPSPENPGPRARELAVVMGSACAQCRGFCCGMGGEHAFITVDTVDRYRRAHPERGPRQILAAYSELIGTDTLHTGCVFQNADGCALPRAMRSDTCNQFLCGGLLEIRDRQRDEGPVRAFVFSTEGGEVARGAFLDAGKTRPVGGA